MAFFVYILECADSTLYIGWTNDIQKRVLIHNTSKQGAKYTKARRPVVLKYYEEHLDVSHALKREAALKRLSRKQKIDLINSKKT